MYNTKEMVFVRVGNYTIPNLRLFAKVYNDIKVIYENFRLDVAEDEDSVARLLGHKSANSGAWKSKIADMRLYGLLEPRAIKVTPLAEKLTYGTVQEKQEAINKTIFNVPLWKELYSKFGVELPNSNFWVQLQRITDLDHLEAQKFADPVRKAYLEDISYIKIVNKLEYGGPDMKEGRIDPSIATINIQAGQFSQSIPYTPEGIELAKGFLDLLGKQLKKPEKPEKKDSKEEI